MFRVIRHCKSGRPDSPFGTVDARGQMGQSLARRLPRCEGQRRERSLRLLLSRRQSGAAAPPVRVME